MARFAAASVGSRRMRRSPALTRSPSLTLSSVTVPPVTCWTFLTLEFTTSRPCVETAPAKSMVASRRRTAAGERGCGGGAAAARRDGGRWTARRSARGGRWAAGGDGQAAAIPGGARARVAPARAPYRDPFIVVLDEPNSNLDA